MKFKNTWKTKEGKILKISKMEDDHIQNCINFLKRKINLIESDFLEVLSFPLPMGEMALLSVEQGLSEYAEEKEEVVQEIKNKIEIFEIELRKRSPTINLDDTSQNCKVCGYDHQFKTKYNEKHYCKNN